MVHPALHEVLTEDQRHVVLWQQRQDLGEDLETPEFTLSCRTGIEQGFYKIKGI